jgi:hypothetical protein
MLIDKFYIGNFIDCVREEKKEIQKEIEQKKKRLEQLEQKENELIEEFKKLK